MKSLKREIRRLLSLLVVAAMIVVSVPQEYLTVRAAEISEDGTEPGAPKTAPGAEVKEAEIPEENEAPALESSETNAGQDQPEAGSPETGAEQGQPEAGPSETDKEQGQPETGSSGTDIDQEQPEKDPSGTDTEQGQPEKEPSEAEKTEGTDAEQTPGTEGSGTTDGGTTPETPADGSETAPADPDQTEETGEPDSEITTEEGETEETEELETPETETPETEAGGIKKAGAEKVADQVESTAEESADVRAVESGFGVGVVPAFDEGQITAHGNGYNNSNVTWRLDANGTLEVTGTGSIVSTASNSFAPWNSYRSKIKAARIDVKDVPSTYRLFRECTNLTAVDLSGLDTSQLTDMQSMFYYCSSLKELDLSGMDTSHVTQMQSMFAACESLTTLNLDNWQTNQVTDMQYLFDGCSSLTEVQNIAGWNVSNVTNMRDMFRDCKMLANLDLSGWNVHSVTTMYEMFRGCTSLRDLNLSGWDVSSVKNMYYMFIDCKSLKELDLSSWQNINSVTTTERMFAGCSGLTSLNLSGWDVSGVKNMSLMFYDCSLLAKLDLSGWTTRDVTNIEGMFNSCYSLESLDLSGFNLENVTSYSNVFYNCGALATIKNPANLTRGGISLPSRDGISWRRPDGTKVTVLVTNSAEPVILSRNKMAGIEFQGENFTLRDAEGNSISLVGNVATNSLGEKIVDLGDKNGFTFTVVPDTGYTVKSMEFGLGDESTLVLEKGTQRGLYTISPRDKESGYIRDEILNVETVPVADFQLEVTYDNDISDAIVKNGDTEKKNKPKAVQVSNDSETSLYVKVDNTGRTDTLEAILYLPSENQEEQLVTRCQDTADMSDAEKALAEQGYDIFRLGKLHENIMVRVSSRYSVPGDAIAGDRDGDINWVIDGNGRLKIKGVGDLAYAYSYYGSSYPAWYEYREQIKTAVVDWTGATDVLYVFYGCTNLEEADVSGFDVSGLTRLRNMFSDCRSLKSVDLSSLDFKNISNIYNMFSNCTSLTEIKTPRNVNCSVSLPNGNGYWRLPDGTVIMVLPQNEAESIAIDTNRTAFTFYGENYTIKDADGKTIVGKPLENGSTIESILLVPGGTKEPVTFTVEASEGYLVRRVWMSESNPTVAVTAGAIPGQYVISPLDIEKGFMIDEIARIETTAVESYNVNIDYNNSEEDIEDVIITNGDVEKKGRPASVAVSNAYDTNIYLKIGKREQSGTWIPKVSARFMNESGSYHDDVLSPQTDTDSMSAREKELSQQGYQIYHLGRVFSSADVRVELTTFYQVQVTTEGFPGNVRIVRYVEDGRDSENNPKWLKEEVKDSILVGSGVNFYLQAEWEDTPDQAHKWCRPVVTAKPEANVDTTPMDGIEGEVQRIRVYDDTAMQFSLKPHTIALEYSFGDLVDISAGSGAKLSEDQKSLEIYSGDNVSFSFGLSGGLQLGEVMDNNGIEWEKQESDGRYTVTYNDMTTLYNINRLTVSVSDPQDRTALYDPEANFQVRSIKFNTKGKSPVYTGEPIVAVSMSAMAYAKDSGDGRKPRQMKLQMDEDFTVSYVNNINAGEAQLIITMVPDHRYFRGNYVYPFTIEKAESPKGLNQTLQVERLEGQYAYQTNLTELVKIEQDGKQLIPTGYRLAIPCDKGGVLGSDAEPVIEGNILKYTIREDADKNSGQAYLRVTAMFDNYQDCELQIFIRVVKKQKLVLGGTVTIADKEYDGKEVSSNTDGLQILSVEGTDGPASAELLNEIKNTLSYHYTGIDGTVYDSDTSPIEIGTYRAQVKVSEENLDYKSDYMDVGNFKITQRNVTVIADDVKLYLDDTMPTQYTCHTENMAEGDVISTTTSFVSCGIQSTAMLAEYPVTVNVSAIKIANRAGKDVTANYIITGQEGKLIVCEPEPGSYTVLYTGIDPLDPLNPQKYIKRSGNEAGRQIEKPSDPEAAGYVFLGWFIDEASTKAWNFDTDIIQSDLTLYAGWLKPASDSVGMALCVQEIMPQTYTGKAIKPMVTVYAADGKTPLKLKKDYTITYKNNTNADTKAFRDEVPQGGIGESLSDTSQGFNSSLPYVIVKGKGNYAGTVYMNFHINPANIASASGYTLKYADQFEEKPGKYTAIVTQFKYRNKKLSYNKDYTLIVNKTDSGEPVSVTLDAKGKLPLTKGTYQVTIVGKDNFTGEMEITKKDPLRVDDKAQLLKNAKVSCKKTVSDVTKESLEAGVQPEDLVVMMNGSVLAQTDYTVECTGNHAVGTATVTVRPGEGSRYVGSKSVTFKIKGTAFKENAVTMSGWQGEMAYTGKALTQNDVVLKGNGKELVYGADYTVSYKNNIKKGNATMVFTANPSSGFSGSFSKKFKITPMDLAAAVNNETILVDGAEKTESGRWVLLNSVSYHKGGAKPVDEVSLQSAVTDTVLKTGKGGDYTVTYTNNKEVSNGSAYMTLNGTGNFAGSIDIYFDITKTSLAQIYQEGRATITSASVKVSYSHPRYWEDYGDGEGEWMEGELRNPNSEFKPKITIKDGNKALRKDVDFTVEYSGNTREELEGGDMLIATIRGIGNYGGGEEEINLDVAVNRKSLSAKKVTVSYENGYTYTGEPIIPEIGEVSYKISNGHGREDDDDYEPPEWNTLSEGSDYRVECSKNIAKGKGTIKIIGIGGYTGSISKSFKINSREIYNKASQPDEDDSGDEEIE